MPLCQNNGNKGIRFPYTGRLSDRVSPFKVATWGMVICTVGLFGFCFISPDTSLLYVIAVLIVIGTGFGVFSSPNSNAIMSCVIPHEYAAATSFQTTMRNIGQTARLCIVTSIMAAFIGDTALADAPVRAGLVDAHGLHHIYRTLLDRSFLLHGEKGR